MERKRLSKRHETAFVSLGTMDDMVLVARKVSGLKVAVEKIREVENLFLNGNLKSKGPLYELAKAASMSAQWAGEAVDILEDVKRKLNAYLRELGYDMN